MSDVSTLVSSTALVGVAIVGYYAKRGLQRLQDQIDRKQLVHKLQFQTEFTSYLELWSNAIEMRQAALAVRPPIDRTFNDKEWEDETQVRIGAFGRAFDSFVDHYSKHRPFVAVAAFNAANVLNDSAFKEWLAVTGKLLSRHEPKYWQEARIHAEQIQEKVDRLCNAIRERIWADEGLDRRYALLRFFSCRRSTVQPHQAASI